MRLFPQETQYFKVTMVNGLNSDTANEVAKQHTVITITNCK